MLWRGSPGQLLKQLERKKRLVLICQIVGWDLGIWKGGRKVGVVGYSRHNSLICSTLAAVVLLAAVRLVGLCGG